MIRIMTIHQIVGEIKKADPDSDISKSMLNQLFRSGKIPFIKRGNRTVADYDTVIISLWEIFKCNSKDTVPFIRTASNAAKDLKKLKIVYGINAKHIRAYLKQNLLPNIEIGNRKYIAIQSFENPCINKLLSCIPDKKQEEAYLDSDYQINRIITSQRKSHTVKRVCK